jgi:hypothetical protein
LAAGEGVAVLNPYVTGLNISGGGELQVKGLVIVNSEGKGVDAEGNPVGTGENYYAARAGNNGVAKAAKFHVVGGVDWPDNFQNIDPNDPSKVLFAGELPVPDPLLTLATPTTSNGVLDVFRGAPDATNTNLKLGDAGADDATLLGYLNNYIDDNGDTDPTNDTGDGDTSNDLMVLYPGIYESISITGGNVKFVPVIYVIKPAPNTQNSMKITGGVVDAQGIMFYATGHNYSPDSGSPDNNDGDKKPPHLDGAEFGAITINAGMTMTPIDNALWGAYYQPPYGPSVSTEFEGMLFYQRRRNVEGLDIQGNAAEGVLQGTLYAKWAHVKLAGQGTYSAQFVVGSMDVAGSGVVTIDYAGQNLGKAPRVFLVE